LWHSWVCTGKLHVGIITVTVAAVIANKNSFIIPISVTPNFLDEIRCVVETEY